MLRRIVFVYDQQITHNGSYGTASGLVEGPLVGALDGRSASHSDLLPVEADLMITVAPGLCFQVSLVVVLSRPELSRCENVCLHLMAFKSLDLARYDLVLQLFPHFLGHGELLLVIAKYGRRILRSLVVHLPVFLSRVMELEEELYQFLEGCFRLVEQDVGHLHVTSVAFTHFLVGRTKIFVGIGIHVTYGCGYDC